MRFFRLGRGRPRLSKVLRPMTTTLPIVVCLNHLKSSGKCHGILLSAPITRFNDIATMALRCFKVQGFYIECPEDSNTDSRRCNLRTTMTAFATPSGSYPTIDQADYNRYFSSNSIPASCK